ncbi:MAG: tRNA lysidine(34) synthetase TilS [Pseudomonadota bacterium]|nr:tRNA lysidine(34) synthetase TilS [Pseudomonadota bacterium]
MALLPALIAQIDSLQTASRIFVGFSGGADSHSLLHALVELSRREALPPIIALHINHGLHEDANDWSAHCAAVASDLGVEFHERVVSVGAGASPEAQARDARYSVFESFLASGDVLLLGHHLDDQVETVLFRLIRGAGPSGLAGIPEKRPLGRGLLMRPLLGIPRDQIENYAGSHQLAYLHDGSNDDTRYDRNFLRHEVLPLIESRWPSYRSGFARSAALSGELATLGHFDNLTEYTRYGGPYLPMDVHDAKSLHRALHGWLKELNAPLPDFVALEEFARQCMHAQGDKLPELRVADYLLQRWRQGIHLYPVDIDRDFDISCEVGGALEGRWGSIVWQEANMGLPAGVSIQVRAPRHGEAVSLGRRPRRSVGQWLQEAGVPPYLRGCYPLVQVGDEIIAIPDVGLVSDSSNLSLCKGGLVPVWTPPKIAFLN